MSIVFTHSIHKISTLRTIDKLQKYKYHFRPGYVNNYRKHQYKHLPDGKIKIETRLENETVWLRQAQMSELFGRCRSTITEHVYIIFWEGELEQNAVCRNLRPTAYVEKMYNTNF